MKFFSKMILRLLGWKMDNQIPPVLKKFIVAVAPHTSWKDFPIGLFIRGALGRHIYYLGKKELFDSPFGFFFWWTGGRPVDRKQHTGLVDEVAKLFAEADEFAIALAPEGTRKKVSDLRTGFYFMARKAQVPIIPCLLDYAHKTVSFLPPFYPTADTEKDLDYLWSLYRDVQGAVPEYSISGDRLAKT